MAHHKQRLHPFGTILLAPCLLALFLLTTGCKKRAAPAPEKPIASAAPSASAVPSAVPSAMPAPLGERVPVGPRQMVIPGQGITAIRFGATAETIKRHMKAPCDVESETRCLYIKQAVDFTLEKGVLVRAKVHLRDRLVPGVPGKAFGTFYGGMQPDIMLGLHRHIVHEEFGKPERSEDVGTGAAPGLVARDFYAGVILEYDKLENGNTVLAAMEVFPATVAAAPSAAPGAVAPGVTPKGSGQPAGAHSSGVKSGG